MQFGFDQQHSGNNVLETGYPTATGNVQIYAVTVCISDAQPIFASSIATPTGMKDVLYVAMLDGSLSALDAADGSLIWSRSTSGSSPNVRSSAALDPSLAYVYAAGIDGKIHKYGSGDGTETVDAYWPEISSLKPQVDTSSAALSIATDSTGTSYLYAATNGYFDGGDTQGHVTAINLQSGTQNVFNTQCSDLMLHFVQDGTARVDDCDLKGPGTEMSDGQMSGIWGRPGVVYDAGTDRIFFATGNGLFDANTVGGFEWGDSVLALHPDGSGAGMGWPLDSYTPSNYADLYSGDLDLGSTSPAILPSSNAKYPHLAIQGGKIGCVTLINLDDLSGQGGPGNAGSPSGCYGDAGSVIFGQPAVWTDAVGSTWAFIPFIPSGLIQAYQLVVSDAGYTLNLSWQGQVGTLTSPIVANGIIYFETSYFGGPQGVLWAVDASSGTQIWTSPPNARAHFQVPIVVNGHVYFIDNAGTLYAYLLDGVFRSGFQ